MKSFLRYTLSVAAGLIGGYTLGFVRGATKTARESAIHPAVLAIGVQRARDAGDGAKAEEIRRVQLRNSIQEVVRPETPGMLSLILGSFQEQPGYREMLFAVTSYATAHPEALEYRIDGKK